MAVLVEVLLVVVEAAEVIRGETHLVTPAPGIRRAWSPAIVRWLGTGALAHPEGSPIGVLKIWIIEQMRGAKMTELTFQYQKNLQDLYETQNCNFYLISTTFLSFYFNRLILFRLLMELNHE